METMIRRVSALVIFTLTLFSFSLSFSNAFADTTMNPTIKMSTTLGDIMIELDAENAPNSTKNFVNYVTSGHYDGLIFHRVIPGFMAQAGGMEPGMNERSNGASIENEADNGLKNDLGTLAMARTNDPHSATSQFFINLTNNDFLNHKSKDARGWGYAVFGKVTDGMDVVNAMAKQPTGEKNGHQDVPVEDIVITSATVVE
ncbi:MAG: peptidyl-prolyl cis-trans isomerase B (cyclophilin B) [Parvicella sp.]|jgi:peptidyl-prolyl cis-trans isomerase B (cyclophilin B)